MSFIDELKRRNVFRVGIAYVVVAWLLLQVTDIVVPILELPVWVARFVLFGLAIGFLPAVIIAWAFELTPAGLKRDKDVDRSASTTKSSGRKLDFAIIAALALALAGVVWTNYFQSPNIDKSIAVLPFANMSADPANEYFSDGLSDTLLHRLAQINDLTVTSRTSSFQFKGQNLDVREIGQQLDVAYVLEGSVQKSAEQLRVIAQLIETESGTHVASMNFDESVVNVFAIQDEIAERIVKELRITLLADEATRLRRRETSSIEAYDEFLLGRKLIDYSGVSTDFAVAAGHFREAAKLDPGFVSAYVGEAMAWIMMVDWNATDLDTSMNEARRLLVHIERLDPDHPELSLIKAWLAWATGDAEEVENLFREHIDAIPNSDVGTYLYAFFLQSQLRFDESIDVLERGLRLNPLNPRLDHVIGWAETGLGQHESAIDRNIRIARNHPAYPPATGDLANSYAFTSGEIQRGILTAETWDDADEFPARVRAELLLLLQDTASVEKWLDGLSRSDDADADYIRAMVELHHGRLEDAVQISKETLAAQKIRLLPPVEFIRIARLTNPGGPEAILKDYEQYIPALVNGRRFNEQVFFFSGGFAPRGYAKAAADYAGLLIELGDANRAAEYIADVESFIARVSRLGWWGYGILDAEIAAIQGDREAALDALEAAIDAGWIENWWFNEKYNPNLVSLHGDPRYEALFQRLADKAAEQLALYRAGKTE